MHRPEKKENIKPNNIHSRTNSFSHSNQTHLKRKNSPDSVHHIISPVNNFRATNRLKKPDLKSHSFIHWSFIYSLIIYLFIGHSFIDYLINIEPSFDSSIGISHDLIFPILDFSSIKFVSDFNILNQEQTEAFLA